MRVVIRHTDPHNFRVQYDALRKNSSARIYHNGEWNTIESSMSVSIAREPNASEQLTKLLVGKSLVIREPEVMGSQYPRDVLIEADEIVCWDRPFVEYKKIKQKNWQFSEYKRITRAVLLSREQMWERELKNDPNTLISRVNVLIKFWDMASCGTLHDAIDALNAMNSDALHRTISTKQFEIIERYVTAESDKRFWFAIGKPESEFIHSLQSRIESIRPKTIGEFLHRIRIHGRMRDILVGMRIARKYESSEFKRVFGEELESACNFYRTILPTHQT